MRRRKRPFFVSTCILQYISVIRPSDTMPIFCPIFGPIYSFVGKNYKIYDHIDYKAIFAGPASGLISDMYCIGHIAEKFSGASPSPSSSHSHVSPSFLSSHLQFGEVASFASAAAPPIQFRQSNLDVNPQPTHVLPPFHAAPPPSSVRLFPSTQEPKKKRSRRTHRATLGSECRSCGGKDGSDSTKSLIAHN